MYCYTFPQPTPKVDVLNEVNEHPKLFFFVPFIAATIFIITLYYYYIMYTYYYSKLYHTKLA